MRIKPIKNPMHYPDRSQKHQQMKGKDKEFTKD